ncbi:MAG: flippase [Candidatus Paceibacterota bacterium]
MSKIKNFLFNNGSARQRAVKNTLWLSVGQIGSRVFRALLVIFAARILGTEGYGVFAYILSLAGFFTIFADVGISQILTREVSKKPEEENKYFSSSLGIKIFLVGLVSIIILFFVPHFSKLEAAKHLIPFAALLVVFDSFRDFINAYFRGKEKMELEALTTTVSNIAITVFGFIALLKWQVPDSVTSAYVWAAGAGTVLGIYLVKDKFLSFFSSFDKEIIKPLLKASWPIALSSALGAFMLNIDIIMIGFFHGASDVGLYASSEKIVGLLYMIPALLAASLFPIISRFVEKKDNKKSAKVLEKGLLATFMIAIPLALGGFLLAGEIISLLYGAEYMIDDSITTLRLLLLTPLIIFPGSLLKNYILAYDKQIKMVPIIGLGALLNVVMNLLLIPSLGIIGSAVATIIATSVLYSGIWVLANKINPFYMFNRLFKIIASSFVMVFFVLVFSAFGLNVVLNIVISSLIYFGVLYAWQEETLLEIKKSIL